MQSKHHKTIHAHDRGILGHRMYIYIVYTTIPNTLQIYMHVQEMCGFKVLLSRELLHTTHGGGNVCVGNIIIIVNSSQYDLFYVNKSVENIFALLLECSSLPF